MAGEHMIDVNTRRARSADEMQIERLEAENQRLRYALQQIAVIDDVRDAHVRAQDALEKIWRSRDVNEMRRTAGEALGLHR